MMESLINHAADLGHIIEFRPLPRHSGLLMPGRVILINSQRSAMTQKVALAHELGHVHHGHDWRQQHTRERDEAQADQYAAELLISPSEYALAEAIYETPGAIAQSLEVPQYLLNIWQRRHSHLTLYSDA